MGNGAVLLDPSRAGEEAHVWALVVACTELRPSCLSWEPPSHEGWAPLLHGRQFVAGSSEQALVQAEVH